VRGEKKNPSPLCTPRPAVPELAPVCRTGLWEAFSSDSSARWALPLVTRGALPRDEPTCPCWQRGRKGCLPLPEFWGGGSQRCRLGSHGGCPGRAGGQGWPPCGAGAGSCAFNCPCKGLQRGCLLFGRGSAWGLVPELGDGEETGPGINGLLIYSSYIIFFPSRAYKSHAPCKNRI